MQQNDFYKEQSNIEDDRPLIVDNEALTVTPLIDAGPPAKTKALYHFFIIIFGVIAMYLLSFLTDAILKAFNVTPATNNILYASLSNFLIYVTLFAFFILLLFLFKLLKPLALQFTKLKPYVYGLFYGFIIILASVSYNLLTGLIFSDTTSNINQSSIELIISNYPFTSFIWIVLVGPVIEEILYRLGLFEGLRQKNRILAYVVSGIIFGFIHFNIPLDAEGEVVTAQLINEFINIPGYIISGLLFAYTYEKIGFVGSSVAHISNNLLSYILTIIRIYAAK